MYETLLHVSTNETCKVTETSLSFRLNFSNTSPETVPVSNISYFVPLRVFRGVDGPLSGGEVFST